MSLALIQGYSSAEEEGEEKERFSDENSSEDDDNDNDEKISANRSASENAFFHLPKSSADSLLPSALDVFSEVLATFALILPLKNPQIFPTLVI